MVGAGAVDVDRLLDRARTRIIADIGTVQFPQIIVDIDKEIRISWQLLQRAPRSTQELLSIYGALLAHGTARTVSEVSLMMPGVRATAPGSWSGGSKLLANSGSV